MNTQTIQDLTRVIELQQEVVTSNLPLVELMDLICRKTQSITEASGAVVEMAEGEDMVYRACSGTLAKSLGLHLKIKTSLSGMSVMTGEVLYCRDSETDSRVDREACRKVGARSMICVPLFYRNKTVGVLKVVDPTDNKFSDRDVSVLRLTAGLLSAAIAQADAMKQLQDSEVKFRTLIESASDGIIITKEGIALEANDTFCKMFGYEQNEIHGKSGLMFVSPEYQSNTDKKIKEQFDKSYETKGKKKNGQVFDIEVLGKTITINHEIVRMTTVRDISEKKLIELALKESEQKSREATKAKSEFLANMSHEIRTPLNGILGMTGLLLDTDLQDQQKKYVEIIRNSGDSLLSIVNDILDFSKIEAKKLTLESIGFELASAIHDIRQILQYSVSQKGLELKINIDPTIPKLVTGDPTRLRQILMNLVSNAIKFTSQGSVTINAFKKGSITRFEVIDTGIGIPEASIPQMFESFKQVDSSTTRKYGGTGLGLSICRELVHAMKGEIGLTSTEGKGSTFWFELPLPEDKETKVQTGKTSVSEVPLKKLRILIAEDNAVNSLIARKMVEKLGHSATLAGNGREAIEALSLAPYDVVLMDCQMPEMDGFQATEAIRKSEDAWKSVWIIAMTAHAMTGDKEKCLSAGMNDYVSKPMKIEDLETVIKRKLFADN